MILRKLFAIYVCASVRSGLTVNFIRSMWVGFKADCKSLWSVSDNRS